MSIMMVCPRDYTLRTKMGHAINFVGGEPTPVPEAAYQEALAKNILPVKAPNDETPVFEFATAEITGNLRDALVFDTIEAMCKENTTEDFGGGGIPKASKVSARIGVAISAQEMSKYWTLYKQIKGENGALPTHPNVELVREVQGLSTRKQLEAFAEDLSIPVPRTRGKSLAELKTLLLYTVINQQQVPVASAADGYVKPDSLEMD